MSVTSTARARSDLLPAGLRLALRRYLLVAQTASTHGGVGERRSRKKGEGIEFEDFRPYAFGDDVRRVDPHVYVRLGQPVVRQYNVTERLTVTMLVDLSASMAFGTPAKADVARAVALGLAICALANSDTVRCGCLNADGAEWYPRLSGAGRIDELEAWLMSRSVGGHVDIASAVAHARPELPYGGIGVIVSDLWADEADRAIDALAAAGQDVIVVRVLSQEEVDPSVYGSGPVRLMDSESGEEVEIELGPSALASYVERMSERSRALRDRVIAHQGRLVDVTTGVPVVDVFERHMREAQVIR